MNLHEFAAYIGYTMMAIGALALTLAAFIGFIYLAWRAIRAKLAWADLKEAITEWESKYPDKAKAWRKRENL